jgi:hypothetical protein
MQGGWEGAEAKPPLDFNAVRRGVPSNLCSSSKDIPVSGQSICASSMDRLTVVCKQSERLFEADEQAIAQVKAVSTAFVRVGVFILKV